MSLLAFLAAATVAAPPPAPEVAREIVVIARQLKSWKGGVSKVGGRMICKTTTSSGDRAADAIRCGAMLSCMKPLEPRIDGTALALAGSGMRRRRTSASGSPSCWMAR